MFNSRNAFDQSQTARTAADLGVAPSELLTHAALTAQAAGRLQTMLRALGPLRSDLLGDPRIRRDLERVCTVCEATRKCGRWTRRVTAAGAAHAHGAPNFCPNRDTLNALKAR